METCQCFQAADIRVRCLKLYRHKYPALAVASGEGFIEFSLLYQQGSLIPCFVFMLDAVSFLYFDEV